MFGCICRFLKRHNRKIIFLGIFGSGAVLGYKYFQAKITEIQEKEAEASIAFARKQHHFDCNQRTCNRTALSMLPNLRGAILRIIDTESLTQQLKSSSKNKLQIWEELKLLSFTRTICSVYVCSMLVLLLRVQLNIVGAYIYKEKFSTKMNGMSSHFSNATQNIQGRYLAMLEHLLDQGLKDLVEHVQVAVVKVIGKISLKEKLSSAKVLSIIHQIRMAVECDPDAGATGRSCQKLCTFILPPEEKPDIDVSNNSYEDKLLDKMISETRDVLDSDDFHTVFCSCLDLGFRHLMDRLAENFTSTQTFRPDRANLSEPEVAMAKVIPIINKLIFRLCSEPPNPFFQELLLMEPMKDLAANVYEAFSQETEPSPQMQTGFFLSNLFSKSSSCQGIS